MMVIVVLNRSYVAELYKNLPVLLCAFFWIILRHLNFICQHFETLCLSHLHRRVGILHIYPPVKMEQTECFETLAYKIRMPGNYPEESIQHSEHGKSLKTRIYQSCSSYMQNCKFRSTFKPSFKFNKKFTPEMPYHLQDLNIICVK